MISVSDRRAGGLVERAQETVMRARVARSFRRYRPARRFGHDSPAEPERRCVHNRKDTATAAMPDLPVRGRQTHGRRVRKSLPQAFGLAKKSFAYRPPCRRRLRACARRDCRATPTILAELRRALDRCSATKIAVWRDHQWIPGRHPSHSHRGRTMTVIALGLIPGLILGWIAMCVAEISEAHPQLSKRRGCRGGTCRMR
jgi:hypothetical protein